MDAHTENRLNAIETIIATGSTKSKRVNKIWVCVGYDNFRITFDHDGGRSSFSLTKKQTQDLIEETIYLKENMPI